MAGSKLSISSRIILNNGATMPRLHLGVYMISGQAKINGAVQAALQAGYRAIDSAEWYGNEQEVGTSVLSFLSDPKNKEDLKREDIFFTTKLQSNTTYGVARKSISRSVEKCGLGYIDLYLLHSPYGGKTTRLECWRAVEDAINEGEVKTGGVSNYGVRHLEELLASNPRIKPAVNQIEVHPFNTQRDIVSFCEKNDIVVQAWAPLVRGLRMTNSTVASLSKKYSCSPAQLLVRWSLQKGYVPLPKSVTPARIVENAEIADIEIADADVRRLDGLDEHLVTDWDPTDCN